MRHQPVGASRPTWRTAVAHRSGRRATASGGAEGPAQRGGRRGGAHGVEATERRWLTARWPHRAPPADRRGADERARRRRAARGGSPCRSRSRGGPSGRSRPGRRRRTARRTRGPPSRPPRRGAGRAGWPPTPPPGPRGGRCARRTSGPASAAGRPVMAAMAVPDASASRQPRAPHPHAVAVGLDDHVADVAGVAVGARRAAGRRARCRRRRRCDTTMAT